MLHRVEIWLPIVWNVVLRDVTLVEVDSEVLKTKCMSEILEVFLRNVLLVEDLMDQVR